MRGEPLNNFGQLSRPMTGSTSFPLSTDLSVIKRHIKEKTSESIDEYCVRYCHVRNLSIVNKKNKSLHQSAFKSDRFGNPGFQTLDGQVV